ncbi:MAG: outer membrane protein transport protein [Deltaproteobacteria bacterium]|nr:outer membrane protein transport protein [Deltaproteobacteria bacterium]
MTVTPVSRFLLCLGLVGGALLPTSTVRAGGIQLWELGTPDVGLAAAGWSARAQDAATLFKNPAGMNQLEVPQLEVGLQLGYGQFGFEASSGTTVPGNNGGNPVGLIPGGSLFWAQSVTDVVAIGVGVFSYFGSALSFDEGFVGRYDVEKTLLVGFSDWFALGAGFNIMLGIFDFNEAVNNPGPMVPDGRLDLNDTDVGFGADVGVLFSIKEKTRVGMTYLSPVKLNFDLPTNFTGLGPILTTALGRSGLLNSTIHMEIKVPQSLVLSAYHDFNAKWALMGNLGWQNWKQFGLIGVTVAAEDTQSLVVDRQYKDTAHVAVGTRFAPVQQWILSLGFAYDSSAVTDENRTIDAPMGQAFRFGVGAEWVIVPAVDLGLAYTLAWFGDMSVNQQGGPLNGDVVGSYDNTGIHFIALSLQWNIGAKKDPDG